MLRDCGIFLCIFTYVVAFFFKIKLKKKKKKKKKKKEKKKKKRLDIYISANRLLRNLLK